MRSRSHDIAMAELYRSDPALAEEVINSILADGDPGELASVLRQLALLFEGMEGCDGIENA
ncbi:transcriptional regulator [Herbaspirillum sp. C7C2]|uniref:transcriptional regulator n=1 Tax=Herbaspirillum sp. C7C2 TaxID=2736666 RepID=UPI001F524F33|nr:transcriptional regulator [Herbaspirillum sp. C7C2]MCI1013720.1 transcriptional regulator [Herbaspirillum sp. C7C2]